jgi:methylated-DNA-[protein]-cysteine S-methyltransferase
VEEKFSAFLLQKHFKIEVLSNSNAVLAISFRDLDFKETEHNQEQPEILKSALQQLSEYFDGQRQEFDFEIAPEGTDFQKKVWDELLKIPFGRTISYKELAKRLGDEKVIRAAASANGKNPIGIVIPCHRVIGNSGDLVGYAGGLSRKRALLDLENSVKNGVLELF